MTNLTKTNKIAVKQAKINLQTLTIQKVKNKV